MQPALDRNTLDRLISLGHKQGHLTTEDLRASLPIESMSAEEIALIVVHLEESGIAVELEDSLISSDPKPRPVQMQGAEIISFPGRSAGQDRSRLTAASLKPAEPQASDAPKPELQTGRHRVHWAVAAAGLLVLVALWGSLLLWGN